MKKKKIEKIILQPDIDSLAQTDLPYGRDTSSFVALLKVAEKLNEIIDKLND